MKPYRHTALACLASLALSAGPAAVAQEKKPEPPTFHPALKQAFACKAGEPKLDCDRRAIKAMAGEFHVRFAFDETLVLDPAYTARKPQRSGGTEWVFVVEDTPSHIVLQHILVMGDEHVVVKHWRQDWTYEPKTTFAFRGNRTWDKVALEPADAAGKWLQSVYEVDDQPRYFGWGEWRHAADVSDWTSNLTWRPLPRREHTKRHDYEVLVATNRHTVTPDGWSHEQDNLKVQLAPDGATHALVREAGLNTYVRIDDYDFKAGRTYWEKTAAYWKKVRAKWDAVYASHDRIVLADEIDGKSMIEVLFDQAERVETGKKIDVDREIDAAFAKFVGKTAPARDAKEAKAPTKY